MLMRACIDTLALLSIALQFGICTPAAAQASLSTEEMVERLRQRQQPRTRGLSRTIQVEKTAQPQDSASSPAIPTTQQQASRPSLSLLIKFEFDSAQLRPESQSALKNLAQALQASELADSRFAVEGHTDARGRPEYNRQLSQRRAESVKDVLAQYGANPARLIAIGKGSSEPVKAADPFSADNRRVRIVNLD